MPDVQIQMKMEKAPDFVVWENDFSEFVALVYDRPFRLQQMWMMSNGSYQEFDVVDELDDPVWITGYAQPQLDAWLAQWKAMPPYQDKWHKDMDAVRDQHIDLDVLTWDLRRRGLIPAGRYLMKIWW